VVRDRTGLDLPDGDYVTVAGWVLQTLGRIPPVGEVVAAPNGTIDITGADERRIQRCVLRVRPPEAAADS
jgi:putative hemolysin